MKIVRKHLLFLFLIVIILSTRVLAFNKDAVNFFGDERHYDELIEAINQSSLKGDYLIAIHKLFNLNARPGIGLLYYPAAILEWKNPAVPFGLYFNIIINALSSILIYLIIKKTYNEKAALIATLLITFSITSIVYIRHLIPYDLAIFAFLLGLYIFIYYKRIFIFGLSAGLAFLTYPGYYYYLLPLPLIFLIYDRSFKNVSYFLIGICAILLLTQVFSLMLGETTTYFKSLKFESAGAATANYGEFMPAWSYIGEYIFNTDGIWGILLVIAILPGFLLMKEKKVRAFFIYLFLMFLILEVYSHILQKTVLFGRTSRPFYLLALIISALIFERIFNSFKNKKYYFVGIGILIFITFINWLPKFLTFKNLTYPKQFQQKAKSILASSYDKYSIEDAIFVNYWNTKDPPPNFYKSAEGGKFYTVNAVQMFPYFGTYDLNRFCENEILLKEYHIQYVFRPYLFEGHKRVMRERMDQDPLYYLLIYCK